MTKLKFRDITPAFGVEVTGLDPNAELDADDVAALRRVFDERSLLVFRGLDDLTKEYQAYLASTVIGLENAAGDGPDDEIREAYVSNTRPGGSAPYGRLLFHSDMMWSDAPFQVLTLFGVEIEQPVVPTAFTSAGAAWDSLPDELRTRVSTLQATHVTGQQMRADESEGELLRPVREHKASVTRPIGWAHPRTGRTLLYVSQMMTEKIEELSAEESERLLAELFAQLYGPALLWEHEWRQGDLVMWDNLAIQHARSDVKVDGPARTLRKLIAPRPTIAGNVETPKFTKVS